MDRRGPVADWTLALFSRRDAAQFGSLQHPREAFVLAAGEDPERP